MVLFITSNEKDMKLSSTCLFLMLVVSCLDTSKTTMTPKEYLDEVFKIVEEYSIRKDSIEFDKIRTNAYAQLKSGDSIENCYPIIQSILKELDDKHSFFLPKERAEKWLSTSNKDDSSFTNAFLTKRLNQDIGYIHMKEFISGDTISIRQYADRLQNDIQSIDHKEIKGWILDLRENKGGNCWPMLAGLGPLLGNGICGYFINNNQNRSSWFYRDGKAGIDSMAIVQISHSPYKLLNDRNPIAVLTGHRTVSSGEIVVTAFHNKSNVRIFGEPTGGLSTGNSTITLSDGSLIFLTTSIYADRKGNIFGKSLEPDEKIPFFYDSIGQPNDPVIKRAVDWIYEN